jgi:alpha-mannosidase
MNPRRGRLGVGLFVLSFVIIGFSQSTDPKPREFTGRLVGHAHIDLSWLWRWEESVHDVAVNTFLGTLAQMEKMPGLTFAQSQPAVYEAIEKAYPELFAAIREKIKEGTWVPVGGMWAEPDLNMPDGEALARQLLYGKRYFLDKFGVDVRVGWNPDSFGHNWQLPQILNKAGIPYYVFGRCAPENTPAFFWQGQNGERVLCYVPQGWYNVALQDGIRDVILGAGKVSPLKDFLILYGAGDHGGGPRDSDLESIRRFKDDPTHPRLEFAVPETFFKGIETLAPALPTVARELNFTFPACYTTQAETKKNNRRLEGLLITAEKFSTIAVASGWRDYYPERDLDEAWKLVLRNQFHDILDGSSIGPVYDEVGRFYGEARDRGLRALDFSLETISAAVDTRGEGVPLLVYNPLAWDRTDVVTVDWPSAGAAPVRILDSRGMEVPSQVVSGTDEQNRPALRLVFIAGNIPSLGYKLFRLIPKDGSAGAGRKSTPAGAAPAASRSGLENEFFKIVLDPKTGWMTSLYDKTAGREVLRAPANLQAIADEPESMSAWELGLKEQIGTVGETGARIEVLEKGPVRAVVRVSAPFRRSHFTQDIILYRGIPRVDLNLRLDWQERNVMIKSAFPLNLKAAAAMFEIPYGAISRPTDGTEVPALRWLDVGDASGEYGVGILNDCKYGFDVKDNVARVSVVHGATYPDPEADRGVQEMVISLYPHSGTWKKAGTLRKGYELNNPLFPRTVPVHPGALPDETAFIRVGPENVILAALKKETGYFNNELIVRLYEAHGEKTQARLELPWSVEAAEADLIERPAGKPIGQGKVLTVALEPYEIKTLRLTRK